jgi:hypothetical protein
MEKIIRLAGIQWKLFGYGLESGYGTHVWKKVQKSHSRPESELEAGWLGCNQNLLWLPQIFQGFILEMKKTV